MSTAPAALAAIDQAAPALFERLVAWSAINSGSGNVAGLTRMATELESALRKLTPAVARVPLDAEGRVAIRATCRPGAPYRVLCSGHYDTVFEADHPFQSPYRSSDGRRLHGPGVADMKGGIVALLAALDAFERSPGAAGLGWTVLLTPDEETGSVVSRAVIEAEAPRHHLGLVFEPARENGDCVQSRSATAIFSLTVHGRAAHAGRDPGHGRNAIVALAELCLALDRLPADQPDLLVNVGRIAGGGTVNIVPDLARAEINVRAATLDAMTAFETELQRLVTVGRAREGYRIEVAGGFNRAPLQSTPERERLFADLQHCGAALGMAPLGWRAVAGGSDGNLLHAAGLPVLDGLGPVGGGLHSDSEYIETDSLVARARLAAAYLIHVSERSAAGTA